MRRRSSRDETLHLLIPRLISILLARGSVKNGFLRANVAHSLEISSIYIRAHTFAVSVYADLAGSGMGKVLSVHLSSEAALVDPDYFRYLDGRCSVLSWKRGEWEKRLMCYPAVARDLRDLAAGWLTRR
jgi:hypothetical protein